MPSYDVKSGDKSVLAVKINSTQTTLIKIAHMNINGASVAWANTGGGVIEVSEQSDSTTKREWIYYTGGSTDSSNDFTLSGVVRGIARDSSDVTSGSASIAQSFSKGAVVRFVTFHDLLNKKANLDRAGTWTAAQTFSTGSSVTPTNTTTPVYHGQSLTTSQRDALTGVSNGDWIYNSTLNQTQWREGGSWVTNATGSTVADASTTVAGKVEEAILSEVSAGTAAGGTGARLFINPSLVKKSSSGAAEGNVVALNSSVVVDPSIGGTGVVSPTSGSVYIGAGSSSMTAVAPTANTFLGGNGTTWSATTGVPVLKYVNTADSTDISGGGTGDQAFSTAYTIPANDLVAGATYVLEASGIVDGGASNRQLVLKFKYGTTTLLTFNSTNSGATGTNWPWNVKCTMVCRSTGASGSVQPSGELIEKTAATTFFNDVLAPTAVTIDTTVSSSLNLTQAWNVDDGTKHCYIKNITITRKAT